MTVVPLPLVMVAMVMVKVVGNDMVNIRMTMANSRE